jgi:ABC-type bacteriocin/lantibiotic exporter with double-glycine peptidase domain
VKWTSSSPPHEAITWEQIPEKVRDAALEVWAFWGKSIESLISQATFHLGQGRILEMEPDTMVVLAIGGQVFLPPGQEWMDLVPFENLRSVTEFRNAYYFKMSSTQWTEIWNHLHWDMLQRPEILSALSDLYHYLGLHQERNPLKAWVPTLIWVKPNEEFVTPVDRDYFEIEMDALDPFLRRAQLSRLKWNWRKLEANSKSLSTKPRIVHPLECSEDTERALLRASYFPTRNLGNTPDPFLIKNDSSQPHSMSQSLQLDVLSPQSALWKVKEDPPFQLKFTLTWVLKGLMSLWQFQPRNLMLLLALALLSGFFSFLFPLVLKQIFSTMGSAPTASVEILKVGLAASLIGIMMVLSSYLRNDLGLKLVSKSQILLQSMFIAKCYSLKLSVVSALGAGTLASRYAEIVQGLEKLDYQTLRSLFQIIVSSFLFLLLFLLNAEVFYWVVALLTAKFGLVVWVTPWVSKSLTESFTHQNTLNQLTYSFCQAQPLYRDQLLQSRAQWSWEVASHQMVEGKRKFLNLTAFYQSGTYGMGEFLRFCILMYTLYLYQVSAISLVKAMAIFFIVESLWRETQVVFVRWKLINEVLLAFYRWCRFLALPEDLGSRLSLKITASHPEKASFSNPKKLEPLQRFSLHKVPPPDNPTDLVTLLQLSPGEILKLNGNPGSGKSLLARFLGLLEVHESLEVHWNQRPLTGEWMSLARSEVAYLAKDYTLFNGKIIDHFNDINTGSSYLQIRRVCARLGLEASIEKLPNGYLERVPLSQSSWTQKETTLLYICKAILKETQIILFDEALDLFDAAEAQRILEQIRFLRPGIVIIYISKLHHLKLRNSRFLWVETLGQVSG